MPFIIVLILSPHRPTSPGGRARHLPRNPSAVRPGFAGLFVKATDQELNFDKKKHMQTTSNNFRLENQTSISTKTPEASKYIVIQLNDNREQVVTFPQTIKHVDAFDAVKRQYPTAKAISAGFYLYDSGLLWTGGMSDTLNLVSRTLDHALVLEFLTSGDRYQWEFTTTN